MTLDMDDLLNSILGSMDRISYIKSEDIPNIDLYMDQVTTLMDKKLKNTSRYPGEDKILTKTMINNYAKNNLLPPPVRKKYSKEHVLVLIFIYYYKGLLSIHDIQSILNPLTEEFFDKNEAFSLTDIYDGLIQHEADRIDHLKEDISDMLNQSKGLFENAPDESREFLDMFAFISTLSFDVYVKKLLIEKLIDGMNQKKSSTRSDEKRSEKMKEKNK
ncbi:MAG: DUF1836 domain-containing protein [Lachnospiraceae bacterium]|nr:DUF1836 domain-containing protein [Lachnospiraceae bacterium]